MTTKQRQVSKHKNLTCNMCGETALYRVGRFAYCKKHKIVAEVHTEIEVMCWEQKQKKRDRAYQRLKKDE